MDLVNQTLGQFQIVEQAGRGGMATVYKAYQANLQRHVAIKVLSPKLADDLDLVKRFLREAQSAAALQHTNVMIIHDVGSEGEIHYIVTEFLEGMTLAQLLRREGALSSERALNIVRQIAGALDYAHSRGFVHRDVKPSNIMIDPNRNDHVTLMDFGLVQVTGGSRITRTGFIMGTPDYMSPEQAKGDPIDRRTDIYSLGVTVYHMLTGDVPFDKSTPHAVLLAHIMEDPPSMTASKQEISEEIEAVVRKAMAKDPDDRYDWSGDMANDLGMAIESPTSFTAPPIRPSMYPLPFNTATAVAQTPPPGPPSQSGQTSQPGPPQYMPTPPGGVTSYPQTPPGGQTPYPPVQPKGRRWVWPVVGLTSFAVLAVVVIVAILSWPQISALFGGRPTPTVAALAPTNTPVPTIVLFDVYPREVTAGEEVTIEWQTAGVGSVTIQPNVRESAPPSGSMVHQPGETTVYQLELPNGDVREVEIVVNPAPGAPTIAYFRVEPQEQVRGQEFKLSWKVSGEITRIEIRRNFDTIPGLKPEGEMILVADQTTTFVLNAYNDQLLSAESVELQVVDPTPASTPADVPVPTVVNTPAPTATATQTPPPTATSTATQTPMPASTKLPATATSAIAPTATPGAQASSGVLYSFEQFGTWTRGSQPYGEFTQSNEQVKSGSYAAKLAYDYGAASSADDFVVFANRASIAGQPNVITAWIYGDSSGHFLNIWIMDAENQVWSVSLGSITFSGWQKMSGVIDPNRPWPSGKVFGPDNGAIDYPVRFYGIVLDRPGTGAQTGAIYVDDISVSQGQASTEPGSTSTPGSVVPGAGQIGRIIFTVKVEEKRYSVYSTDPNWSKAIKIGETDWNHSTCIESNTAATALDGTTVGLRPVERCQVAGTVGSCPSPDGKFKVNTNNIGGGRFSVVLFNVSEDRIQEAYYEGDLNIRVGLNWAPDSSHFLFTDRSSVYRADVSKPGVYQIIPYKDPEWPLQYSSDGAYVMYLKPVSGAISDVFVASPSGGNERNVTNAPISVKLCPRWRN